MQFLLILSLLIGFQASADRTLVPKGSTAHRIFAESYNLEFAKSLASDDLKPAFKVLRPMSSYDHGAYLLISGTEDSTSSYASEQQIIAIKQSLLSHLPTDVTAVIYVKNRDQLSNAQDLYSQFIDSSRVKFVVVEGGTNDGFWARDALPIPVFAKSSGPLKLGLVDARYYFDFEADSKVGKMFDAPVNKHGYEHQGGNFLSDSKGNCFVVNRWGAGTIPEAIYKSFYGCQTTTVLPHLEGIGHVDESIVFVSDTVALSDNEEYRKVLIEKGYQVVMLPKSRYYESYVNSLLVNGTAFVPTFGRPEDEEALSTYKSLGFNVVAIRSERLARQEGVIHCITMVYPEAPFKSIMKMLSRRY